jgi:hypothetical protein
MEIETENFLVDFYEFGFGEELVFELSIGFLGFHLLAIFFLRLVLPIFFGPIELYFISLHELRVKTFTFPCF